MRESTLNPGKNTYKSSSIVADAARKAIFSVLKNIKQGCLVIEEGSEQFIFGECSSRPELNAHVVVEDRRAYSMVFKEWRSWCWRSLYAGLMDITPTIKCCAGFLCLICMRLRELMGRSRG